MTSVEHDVPPHLRGELLKDEFLSLPVAATVAYYKITEKRRRVSEGEAAEMMHLVAIALSTVVPIYMSTAGGSDAFVLSAPEIEELLFRPLKSHERPGLDNLKVRREDLQRGVETLKASRQALWKRQ